MGDSASYLWSVFHDGPYDRSWTYPAWFLGPSTLTLGAFGLASAASQLALSTEPVPRYLIVAAWVNLVVAARIICVLATRLPPSDLGRPAGDATRGADALT